MCPSARPKWLTSKKNVKSNVNGIDIFVKNKNVSIYIPIRFKPTVYVRNTDQISDFHFAAVYFVLFLGLFFRRSWLPVAGNKLSFLFPLNAAAELLLRAEKFENGTIISQSRNLFFL